MKKEETKYFVSEFASRPEVFEVTGDLIRAAFAVSSRNEATKSEAKKMIEEFKNQEVS